MATYTLYVQQRIGGQVESKAHDTAAKAIGELDAQQAAGAKVHSILRDGKSIDEATVRADEEAERATGAG